MDHKPFVFNRIPPIIHRGPGLPGVQWIHQIQEALKVPRLLKIRRSAVQSTLRSRLSEVPPRLSLVRAGLDDAFAGVAPIAASLPPTPSVSGWRRGLLLQ